MKLQLSLALAAALVAGPAAAQGTFSPGQKPGGTFGSPYTAPKPKTYGVPASPAPAPAPRPYGAPKTYGAPAAPKAPGFEPYKPYSGGSVYAQPKRPRMGAKPCETSVFSNACEDEED